MKPSLGTGGKLDAMTLTWMPPRHRKLEDLVYPQVRHWLVDGSGRILAAIIEPQQDDAEDSFDVRLYTRSLDDEAYFISLDHAKAWAEQETVKEWEARLKFAADLASVSKAGVPK